VDEPRYLLRSGRTTDRPEDAGEAHGYTDRRFLALDREPEPIDEETQRRISLEARTRFAETRSEELARKDSKRWCERLRKVEMRAIPSASTAQLASHQDV
jgi:hypothetical protein